MNSTPRQSARKILQLVFGWLLLLGLICRAGTEQPPQPSVPAGMVVVPSGTYVPLFRASSEPAQVSVRSFLMDILPVTNEDYLQFVTANPKWRRSAVKRLFADENYLKNWAGDLDFGKQAASNAPVTWVSWFAAKAYCSWMHKRLPTTAEWEYAAAASPTRPDGDKDPVFVNQLRMWASTPAPEQLPAVGQSLPNFYGIQDLHELGWEWVADFSTAMVTGDARGDTGLERQLFCGSGAQGAKDTANFPAFMRYGFRSSLKADYTVHNLSFRCAKDL